MGYVLRKSGVLWVDEAPPTFEIRKLSGSSTLVGNSTPSEESLTEDSIVEKGSYAVKFSRHIVKGPPRNWDIADLTMIVEDIV